MSRKKKTKEVKVVEKPDLVYNGKVNIKIRTGNRVVKEINKHNAGTLILFKAIARALVGIANPTEMPLYIDLTNNGTSILENKRYISDKYVTNSSDGSANANFEFLIPFRSLNFSNSDKLVVNGLSLFNQPDIGAQALATIELSGKDILTLSNNEDTNLMITWVMNVTNLVA